MTGRHTAAGWEADVELLRTAGQLEAAAQLLWNVWGARTVAERTEVISTSLLRTLFHTGNYVAGAYVHGELVGCIVGFFGSLSVDGRPDHLHSSIAGVLRAESNRGVGYAMKRHQRQWALERGLRTVRWTFDPLVSRNAYFNLCKLGATVASYETDYYGQLDDGVNNNQDTDRLLLNWDLLDPWVEQAIIGEFGEMRRHALASPEAVVIEVPEDISRLREVDGVRAERERAQVRERFRSLLSQGYRVVGMDKARKYILLPVGVEAVHDE
ncbi:GNAT family N-acetyltransferase [Actinoplanes sp. NPDC020271]|uniref:GNAT family N-acetyltransferase n=1 Tax=Actinoplanes sp. NPDC020271 TaxID=3363896 RepID=UPI0037A691F4